MRKGNMKWVALILTLLLSLMMLAGCSETAPETSGSTSGSESEATSTDDQSADQTSDAEKGTVKLVYVNWSEGVAMTNLAKAILEDKMGYTVEITMADVAPIFTSLANGDQDAFMDAWLPTTHASYMDEYGDDLDDLGNNFEDAKIGLVVPSYVAINSIEELNDVADDFNHELIGIDSGAGIMKATDAAIEAYGLDYELIPGSGPAMTAALGAAIEDNEAIAVTGWAPHWKFARWDLKFLEDPQGVYGGSENIHTITRKGFSDDMPDVAAFLTNFYMDGQQLGDLMGAIADSDDDPVDVARVWMADHEELVNSWIPAE
ncbi:MAG: glycine betaine/proline transport system substrate-binding protein [Clostridiales bacterium]|nr:glycine betaine/proline transport system substrate-binding protein [Clostridiales bacterium]MDN5298521.1 glycine betaine/proline transport system substrate-binding protein [Clostridiales bacterium]